MGALLLAVLLTLPAVASAKSIVLQVYSANQGSGQDKNIETAAQVIYKTNYTPDRVLMKVGSAWEFRKKLLALKKKGTTIKRLVIQGHGASGFTHIIDEFSLPSFKGLDAVFDPGAEIVFHSCSVAADKNGRKFLSDLGKTLLSSGGGRIDAPLWYYVGVRSEARYISPAAMLQDGVSPLGYAELTVKSNGDESMRWTLPGEVEVREQITRQVEQTKAVIQAGHKVAKKAAPTVKKFLPIISPAGYVISRLFD